MAHIVAQRNKSNIGTHVISIKDRAGAILCPACNEWYLQRFARRHRAECVQEHPEAYTEGVDYVSCPECHLPLLRLGRHLREAHGWSKDKIAIEKGRGLKLTASCVRDKWAEKQDFAAIQERREATCLARYGHVNPFADPDIQKKLKETSRRRYGVDHPMRNEEVFIRQRDANGIRPTGLEAFFDEHTPDTVVYSGYGARFVRTRIGVRKLGRIFYDLNPDFMVVTPQLAVKAQALSKERKVFPRHWRPKKVAELLGQWWHSEEVTGIPEKIHAGELAGAYNDIGIDCIVLWEKEVLDDWDATEKKVRAWLDG